MTPSRVAQFRLMACCFILLVCVCGIVVAESQHAAFQQALEQKFADSNSAVLLIDIRSGKHVGSIRPEIFSRQFPPGSLMKAFTLIAFFRQHGDAFPDFYCPRRLADDRDACWDKNGHGNVSIQEAIAFSCNVYFRRLSTQISEDTFLQTLREYSLLNKIDAYANDTAAKMMVGSTMAYNIEPRAILRAYCSFYNGGRLWPLKDEADRYVFLSAAPLNLLNAGMRMSAEKGSSLLARRKAGVPLLGKTGTTLQKTGNRINWKATQGWWIGFFPADHPQIAVMAFSPQGRGATDAAPIGGEVISLYRKFIR